MRPPPPTHPTPRGHRVLGVSGAAIRGLEVTLGERRFAAWRAGAGWEIDGRPAGAGTAEALGDLAEALAGLRAIDVFRPRDEASFGLDRPMATVAVTTDRGVRRLAVGALNAGGSAFYARREGAPRVVLVGTLLRSGIERVFFNRDELDGAPAQRPEMG